jgi:hypothetical protein
MGIELPEWVGYIESAINPVKRLKDAISGLADALDRLVRKRKAANEIKAGGGNIKLPDQFTGEGRVRGFNQPLSGGRAFGGMVTGGEMYAVGERGPELFIPASNGEIVPNSRLGGGPTYNITVQAGVGDPVRIGEEVVTAIKRYERVSGPVFASA